MELNKFKHRKRLLAWEYCFHSPEQVAELIERIPGSIQTWVAKIVWWDRYAGGTGTTHCFRKWVDQYMPENPDPKALADGLILLGYKPEVAYKRANTFA